MENKVIDIIAFTGMAPDKFVEHLMDTGGCPKAVAMSEAVWDMFLKPLYEQRPTVSDGNRKIAEILFEAASALQIAGKNGTTFDMATESVADLPIGKMTLEVFLDGEEYGTPAMEISIAGERELKRNPSKLGRTDTPPAYFMLHTIGTRI